MEIKIHEHEVRAIRWAIKRGLEFTSNDNYYDALSDIDERIEKEL